MTATQTALLPDPIDEAWLAFHHRNPSVYVDLVVIVADFAHRNPGRTISLRDVFGKLRVDAALAGRDAAGFKLNNNYTSRYARLIAANHPILADVIATRQLHTDTGDLSADLEVQA